MTSANIVGYAAGGLQSGGTVVMPQFLTMAETEKGQNVFIDDLKPVGDDLDYNIIIETLDFAGRNENTIMWAPGGDIGEEDESCWQDGDQTQKMTGIQFDQGQALWVTATSEDQMLQSAGQVSGGEYTAPLRSGGTATGNPFPVVITIDDIVPTGDDCDYNVIIETLDYAGRNENTIMWAPGGDIGEEDESCWQDGDQTQKMTGIPYNPGQGLWVTGSSEDQALIFTSPALKNL